MKENIKPIFSGKGLGVIFFGMSKKEVEAVLGSPDEQEVYDLDGDNEKSMHWHFDDSDLSMTFDEEDDWKLTTLAISSSFYELEGKSLIGLSMESVKKELIEIGVEDLEFEDWSSVESPNHKLLSSDSMGLNFWFDDELLTEIQWGPLFEDEETIIWPDRGNL